jgi:dipeptidase E
MSPRALLLLSNSRNADAPFLEHAREALVEHLRGVRSACFVPYAGVTITYDEYTARVRAVFDALGIALQGVHASPDPREAVAGAESIIVGGGNTFRLLERLQHYDLLDLIRSRVAEGAPYVGWSAGSVLAGPTIGTTNDMPVVAPQGFASLGLVGFQINAHFTDAHPPGFRGETRRERLAEYVALNPRVRVVGLPEGNWLSVRDASVVVHGPHATPWFGAEAEGALPLGTAAESLLEPEGPPEGPPAGPPAGDG